MDGSPVGEWLMRIEGALSAHFKQPYGPSRPGTDWKVGLKRGDELHTIFVRTYFREDASAATRADTTYQGDTVMGYVSDLIRAGWSPTDPVPNAIDIGNSPEGPGSPPKKSWWRVW
jgi:hypothetical protein